MAFDAPTVEEVAEATGQDLEQLQKNFDAVAAYLAPSAPEDDSDE